MLFDTDIIIWALRGSIKAAAAIDKADERSISAVSYMELVQGVKDKKELKQLSSFLSDCGIDIMPLTENIGHRAAIYMEEYTLKSGLRLADALIAATAAENNLTLYTSNIKHYKTIEDLNIKTFKP
ncbi:MAG: PIN domain-containing protein [Candidatus Goldiibacteriota bacterium]